MTRACINRIRLEFKEDLIEKSPKINRVLIESDWNLKVPEMDERTERGALVLIESDWNLKFRAMLTVGRTEEY